MEAFLIFFSDCEMDTEIERDKVKVFNKIQGTVIKTRISVSQVHKSIRSRSKLGL